jgi:hypothetical protein
MGLLYGRAGRLTAQNGGFRPGQLEKMRADLDHRASEADEPEARLGSDRGVSSEAAGMAAGRWPAADDHLRVDATCQSGNVGAH